MMTQDFLFHMCDLLYAQLVRQSLQQTVEEINTVLDQTQWVELAWSSFNTAYATAFDAHERPEKYKLGKLFDLSKFHGSEPGMLSKQLRDMKTERMSVEHAFKMLEILNGPIELEMRKCNDKPS
jgi:hypothetical protein